MRLFRRRRGTPANSTNESPETSAARWLARRELGLLEDDEAAAIERWRQEPRHDAALNSIQAALDEVQAAATAPGIMRMREEALAHRPRGPLLLGNVPAGIAAAVLGAVVVVAFLLIESGREVAAPRSAEVTNEAAAVPASPLVYETRKGELRAIELADGSTVTLNTASRVEVSLTSERRSVRLLSGQALFAVARDSHRPFTVAAGSLKVTALGTQFDVRLQPEGAQVVLLEGHVRVEPLTLQGIARLVPWLARHELNPGEQLVADQRNEIAVGVADTERSVSWREGRLVFRGEALEDAVAEFNRYSEHQLVVTDATLARLPVSGVFSAAHPENFIAAVAGFYGVNIERRGAQVTELSLDKK